MLTSPYLPGYRSKPQQKEDKPKRQNRETPLQSSVTKWLKLQYPGLMFFSDFAAGLYLPPVLANIRSMQACDSKFLDLTILRACGGYHGLVLEIKVTTDDLFLKDGITLKSSHVKEQYQTILKHRADGYYADFGVGFDDITNYINCYLSGRPLPYKKICV
jgi:hypothetical protein